MSIRVRVLPTKFVTTEVAWIFLTITTTAVRAEVFAAVPVLTVSVPMLVPPTVCLVKQAKPAVISTVHICAKIHQPILPIVADAGLNVMLREQMLA